MLVRFAARDPGAANIVASFLRQWTPVGPAEFDLWSLGGATRVFARAGFQPHEFPGPADQTVLEQAWAKCPALCLITGTSHYAPFEPLLWAVARQRGCQSLAVIDYWSNLQRRFALGKPDAVGAIDERQARELINVGFSPDQVVVIGHPWLSLLLSQRHESSGQVDTRDSTETVRVLFVSEPISQDVAGGYNDAYGFDEFDAFALLHKGMCAAVSAGAKVCLAVKFHPYESPHLFQQRTGAVLSPSGLTLTYLDQNESAHQWVIWADLVAGISSVLLLEAVALGKPCISLQPGLRREDLFGASRFGFAQTLTDPTGAESTIASLILSADEREVLFNKSDQFLQALPADAITPMAGWIYAALGKVR